MCFKCAVCNLSVKAPFPTLLVVESLLLLMVSVICTQHIYSYLPTNVTPLPLSLEASPRPPSLAPTAAAANSRSNGGSNSSTYSNCVSKKSPLAAIVKQSEYTPVAAAEESLPQSPPLSPFPGDEERIQVLQSMKCCHCVIVIIF